MSDKEIYDIDRTVLDLFLVVPYPQPRSGRLTGIHGQKENKSVTVRMSRIEHDFIHDIAQVLGIPASQYCRWVLLHAAVAVIEHKESQGFDMSELRRIADLLPTIINPFSNQPEIKESD